MSQPAEQKHQLRQLLRQTRRNLTSEQQQQASVDVVETLKQALTHPRIHAPQPPQRIAAYWASDGEIDLHGFIQYCHAQDIELYLPVVQSAEAALVFARLTPNTPLTNNRFGIPEPQNGQAIAASQLSLVLMPLVGFDDQGGRLGMGGGFYDRTFADRQQWSQTPKLIGVAHECQKVERVPRESWDIELDAVVTDLRCYF